MKRQAKENTLRSGLCSKKEPNPSWQDGWRWSTSLAASGGPPHALIEAYLERAETTRRHQEMAIEILEERDHLEDAPQAEQDPGVTDEVRDVQKPVFFQAMERRALPSGAWVDAKPKMTIDAELSLENKSELITAW